MSYTKAGSNTSRKVLEKHVDAGENLRAQKTKAMPRTLTIVLMTNPSRGSTFYFRARDGERFDRCEDILTWTHYDEIKCENVSHFADAHASPVCKSEVEVYPIRMITPSHSTS